MRRPPPPSGFTLIELIVTMILVGVLAVAVLPRFDALGSFDAAGFGDQLQAVLRHAQKTAIAQRRNVAVSYSASGATVCSYSGATTPCNTACGGAAPVALPGGSFRPAATATLAAGGLCFDAMGRPYQGAAALVATLSIAISDAGVVIRAIRVEPETGYVH